MDNIGQYIIESEIVLILSTSYYPSLMLDPEKTAQKIQYIEVLANSIKEKYQHMVYDQAVINQILLNLINNVALIKNLTRNVFTFTFFTKEVERKEAFKNLEYLSIYAPQLINKDVNQ